MTVAERKLRASAAVAAAAERDRLMYADPQTGLMWARNGDIAGKKMNWFEAMSWARNLNYGGYNDWRLPTKEEFESFLKRGGDKPSKWFNANGFNSVQSDFYWSGSVNANYTDYAWLVYMYNSVVYDDSKSVYLYAWPLRGGK